LVVWQEEVRMDHKNEVKNGYCEGLKHNHLENDNKMHFS